MPDGTTAETTATTTEAASTTAAATTTAATATETAAATTGATTATATEAAGAATTTAASTTATEAGKTTEAAAAATSFPDNWRDLAAGGDEKLRKMLDRYASPKALAEAQAHARDAIAKGVKRQPLAADATPEQIAEYRQANGIPEAPDKYDTSLPDGLVIGEADKPVVDGYLKYAHENHLPNDVVKQNLSWYYKEQDRQREVQHERDATARVEVEADLKSEYGPDYKRYVTAANEFMGQAGAEFRDQLMQARMPDGSLVGANPKAVRWLINTALELNPFATVTPSTQGGASATAEAERAALITESGNHDGPYWKGPMAAAKQARLLELNRMFEKVKK